MNPELGDIMLSSFLFNEEVTNLNIAGIERIDGPDWFGLNMFCPHEVHRFPQPVISCRTKIQLRHTTPTINSICGETSSADSDLTMGVICLSRRSSTGSDLGEQSRFCSGGGSSALARFNFSFSCMSCCIRARSSSFDSFSFFTLASNSCMYTFFLFLDFTAALRFCSRRRCFFSSEDTPGFGVEPFLLVSEEESLLSFGSVAFLPTLD
mmetsp:Transcript_38788/g.75351  ORF Transcript_38788/g.75351 Transcript_38788/m.75351 type:complete len:209 (+) Transcript_38788:250-876(+)